MQVRIVEIMVFVLVKWVSFMHRNYAIPGAGTLTQYFYIVPIAVFDDSVEFLCRLVLGLL